MSSTYSVTLTLTLNPNGVSEEIFVCRYHPNMHGVIFIDLTDIVRDYVKSTVPTNDNDYVQTDKDWEKMRMSYSNSFYKYYNKGFDEFHFGDWSLAKKYLDKVLRNKDDDKPSQRMLDIMKKYNYIKPENFRNNNYI